jgi:hypothetical protein
MTDNQNKGFKQEKNKGDAPPNMGVSIKGNVPPELLNKMQTDNPPPVMQQPVVESQPVMQQPYQPISPTQAKYQQFADPNFENVLRKLQDFTKYEEIVLPSLGKFYKNGEAPSNGVLHIRPMTGSEEQILATPKFIKKGQAINKIFESCVKEKILADSLLSADRTYILIYLRGISFTSDYEVEISCPACGARFQTAIDLNSLIVNQCPDDFNHNNLVGVLPTTKLNFRYRLATGKEELEVAEYREKRVKEYGDNVVDDTLLYRASLLLEEIDGVTNRQSLQMIIGKLPVSDVSFLRNLINDPPFGVNTKVDIMCPSCTAEFQIDMPMEANFFFPRRNAKQ